MLRRDFVKSLTALGTGLGLRRGLALDLDAGPPAPDPLVKRVLVVFKCHFDAGFIDTQSAVLHKYFSQFFPQAIRIGNAAIAIAGKPRYTWTTGSWLLYEYLEQASPEERKRAEVAIEQRVIAWHALPFTWQSEMLDQSMIEGSLAISGALDARFGRFTNGAKMSDVPGHTRAIIAPLAKHGVKFLDIGVNDASTPAVLPPLFLWQDPSGATLAVMYHAGYGGVARVPGSDLALAIQVRDDNSGPHTPEEIDGIYRSLGIRFPNAEILPASLSDMANAVDPHRASLPVVTGEIGDTWIHGVGSDPLKVARYRELARLRQSWIAGGQFRSGDPTDLALLRHLLLEVEHTWGTDTKTWLDFNHYKPDDLQQVIETKNYKVVQFSWTEKRQDLMDAIAVLPDGLREQAGRAIQELQPRIPFPIASAIPSLYEGPIETAHFIIDIEPKTGAITQLRNKKTGRDWAGKTQPLALFCYQTLSQQDYDRFFASYIISKADWAFKDFGKPNIDKFGARSQEWLPRLEELHIEKTIDLHRIIATLRFDDEEAVRSGRAAFPREAYLEITLPNKEPVIDLSLSWFHKPSTRMPEAMWLTFNPVASNRSGWTLDKSGVSLSPSDVVVSGNRHMHAVSRGISYREGAHRLSIETLDAPLVALGERTPLNFSNAQPDMRKGIHFNLLNNAWGTNYIMWFGEDMRFRYRLRP